MSVWIVANAGMVSSPAYTEDAEQFARLVERPQAPDQGQVLGDDIPTEHIHAFLNRSLAMYLTLE